MVDNKHIKLSPVAAWTLATLIATSIGAAATWKSGIDDEMIKIQINQVKMNGLIITLDNRLKENLEIDSDLHRLESEFGSVKTQCQLNTNDILSRRGIHFNMPDYDKYVRPVQRDLLERVIRLEAKADNK